MKYKKPVVLVGLRTATNLEITSLKLELGNQGYKVLHKTHDSKGKKLPFNGVLVAKR